MLRDPECCGPLDPGKGFDSSIMISADPTHICIHKVEPSVFLDLATSYKLLLSDATTLMAHEDVYHLSSGDDNMSRVCLCRYNAEIAIAFNKHSIAQIWSLCAVAFESLLATKSESCLACWSKSSLGSPLLEELLKYLEDTYDLQTTACIYAICGPALLSAYVSEDRINSVLFAYADSLQGWGAYVEACLVLKFIPSRFYQQAFKDVEYKFDLGRVCNRLSDESKCHHYDGLPMHCSVCEGIVKYLSIHCPDCGHGGHLSHIKQWFTVNGDCPTGCGCICGTRFAFEEDEQSKPILPS